MTKNNISVDQGSTKLKMEKWGKNSRSSKDAAHCGQSSCSSLVRSRRFSFSEVPWVQTWKGEKKQTLRAFDAIIKCLEINLLISN